MLALRSTLLNVGSGMSTDGGRSVVPALDRRVGGGGGAIFTCEDVVLSAMLGGYDPASSPVCERFDAAVLLRGREETGLEARI